MNEVIIKNSFLGLTFIWVMAAVMSFIMSSDPAYTVFLTDFLFLYTIIAFAPWAILGGLVVLKGMLKG